MKTGRIFRKWWWVVLPIGLGMAWAATYLLDRLVKERLQEIGNRIAGDGYTFSIEHADPNFFAGSIKLTGILLNYDTARMGDLRQGDIDELLQFSANELMLRQVSYWDLLTEGDIHVRAVEISRPNILYHFKPKSQEDPLEEEDDDVIDEDEVTQLPSLIRVDTLMIRGADGSTTDITGTRPAFIIGGLDINAFAIDLRTYKSGLVTYTIGGAEVHAWQLSAELPPLYDLNVSDLHVEHPSGTAMVKGLRLDPRYTEQEYGAQVDFEQDLFKITVDTLTLAGVDAGRFLSEQILHMERMIVHAPRAQVYRDKTIVDGPFNYKHLPVSGLRSIGISLKIDTVEMKNGKVEYFEKDKNSPDYGMVSFSDINGKMTGLNNSRDADTTSHLVVNATARAYEQTTVQVSYKAAMSSSRDAFTLDASLGSLPFSVFNRMTDDLLNVKASDGKIHSMRILMQGNEWQASGTLDLAYEDLRIDLVPKAEQWHQGKIKNLLGNALVRRSNMPGKKNYRQGEFVVDRRKDRAVFNFIWQAVKAGSVDTMAPGLLRKEMRKAVSQPSAKRK